MNVRYAVTFEFETQAPITTRGTVAASSMPTCFARAARAAAKAHPGLRWTSMVCVLLERLDPTGEDTAAAEKKKARNASQIQAGAAEPSSTGPEQPGARIQGIEPVEDDDDTTLDQSIA